MSKTPPPQSQVTFPSGLVLDVSRVLYAQPQEHLGIPQMLIKFDNGTTLWLSNPDQIREVQQHFPAPIPAPVTPS